MRIRNLVVMVSFFLFLPMTASAVDLTGESRTYLQSRETVNEHQLLPLYEYFDFSMSDFANPELSFHLGGWARQDLTHIQSFDNRSFNGDLQYAYLGLHKEKGNGLFNLGRVMVYDGIASELVDGLSARTDLRGGFGISAYGGIPVESDFDDRDGDILYGGRLSHQLPEWYNVGLSYLKERNDSSDFRSEAGVDLRLFPGKKLELNGRSTYNGETSGWMEHAYYLTLAPIGKFRVSAEATSTNYQDYFQAVDNFTTSVFRLTPAIVNPKEKLLLLGGQIAYAFNDQLEVGAIYRDYDYSVADSSEYYGVRLAYSHDDGWGGGFSFHLMDGQTEALKYNESRLYGYRHFGKTDVTIDLFNISYDKKRDDIKNAYTAVVALGYNLTDNARIALDLDYSRNPTYDYDFRGFLKFVCKFGLSPLFKSPPKATAEVEKTATAAPVPEKKAPAVERQVPKAPKEVPVPITAPAPKPTAPTPKETKAMAEVPSDPWALRMMEWKNRIENTPVNKYTIQVEIAGKRISILKDLERLLPEYDAMVLRYQVKNWKAYTLIVGIYDSRQEGNRAVEELPASIRKLGPLVKTLPTIQKGLIPVEKQE